MQVKAVNEGDRAAYVSLSDELPAGAVLTEGVTSSSRILHPSENITITYSMRMKKAGSIVIPSAIASFVDPREYEDIVYSRRFLLSVSDPDEQSGYGQADYDDASQESAANAIRSAGQLETAENDHGIFRIFYDLIEAVSQYISNLRQK
jgi:hypothetical protein